MLALIGEKRARVYLKFSDGFTVRLDCGYITLLVSLVVITSTTLFYICEK